MVESTPNGVKILRVLEWISPALLLFPYLILLFYIGEIRSIDTGELWWALKNSIYQAAASAIGCMLIGFIFALGLNRIDPVSPRIGNWARAFLLLPSLMPPFFVLLTMMSWLDPLPFGLIGITIVHVFQYSGMVGVSFAAVLTQRLARLAEVSHSLGAKRFSFFRVSWPLIRRDFLQYAMFVFLVSFSSFSIPLVMGGGRGTTLEILIYEKIRVSADIGSAVFLSLLQTVILGLLLWRVPLQFHVENRRKLSSPLISSSTGSGLILAYAIFFLLPWILHAPIGFLELGKLPDIWTTLLMAAGGSLFFALNAALIIFVLLAGISLLPMQSVPMRFLRVYFPPSVALIGIAGIILSQYISENGAYLFSLVILFLPMIYRFGFETKLESLQPQLQVAEVLGAGRIDSWRHLVVPQMWSQICFLLGLAFLWCLGDFAMAKFFLPSGSTLPLLVESLMTSYRVHAGMAVGLIILILGALLMILTRGVGRVFD